MPRKGPEREWGYGGTAPHLDGASRANKRQWGAVTLPPSSFGSPPRMWGKRIHPPHSPPHHPGSPPRVWGQLPAARGLASTAAVHPHVRGDNSNITPPRSTAEFRPWMTLLDALAAMPPVQGALAGLSTYYPRERRRATTKVTKSDEGVTKPSSPAQSLAQTGFEALG